MTIRSLGVAFLIAAACHRPSFVESLRCGMTREEVRSLARRSGYNNSDATWLARKESANQKKSLNFVDLTFHGDQLVAYRIDRYDPKTKRVTRQLVDLCGVRPLNFGKSHTR